MPQHPIIEAVDNLTLIHDVWAAEDRKGRYSDVLPGEFEHAAEELFDRTRMSDVPAPMRGLVKAIEGFEVEWGAYAAGNWDREGVPKPQLWRSLREVFHQRTLAEELKPKMPESVKLLRAQKVPDHQIANHIYGYKGVGPFLGPNGQILHDLIDQEAEKAHSVIPEGWIPEQEKDRLKMHHIQTENRLKTLEDLSRPATKPAETVEGLLREKQYPDVIAKLCNVTVEQVHKIAEVLGIEISFRPNLAAERAPHEPPIAPEAAAALDNQTPPPVDTGKKKGGRPKNLNDATRERILEIHDSAPDMGANEIAEEIGGISPRQVAQILQQAEKAKAV